MLVRASEVQQVADDLHKDADTRSHAGRMGIVSWQSSQTLVSLKHSSSTLIMENRDLVSSSECSRM